MAELVAKTYAEALFEVATESDKIDQIADEVSFVLDAFAQYPEFYELFKTPQVGNEEKKTIMEKVFKEGLSTEVMNFLKILLDKRRGSSFIEIAKEYQRLTNEHNNIIEAVAVTATPMKDEDKSSLESKLSQMTSKTIRLKNEVDKTIIGGMLVKMGDKVIDGTIQSRLGKLKENLAQIIV